LGLADDVLMSANPAAADIGCTQVLEGSVCPYLVPFWKDLFLFSIWVEGSVLA